MTDDSETTLIRSPRIRGVVNGDSVNSIMHAEVFVGGSHHSSRFELTVSTLGDLAESHRLALLNGRIEVSILMRALPDGEDIVLFEGLADGIAIDPVNNVSRIHGRDYSSILINSAYQKSFSNQTASEIVNYIADRHGLSSNIETTSAMVGSYYHDGHNQVLLNTHSAISSEWDLLRYLAKAEGFELFFEGTVLVFASATSLPRNYVTLDKSNLLGIKFLRSFPLADTSNIIVKSWNSWQGQMFLHSEEKLYNQNTIGASNLDNRSGAEVAIIKPNLTLQDAAQLAQRYLRTLDEQRLKVDVVMPGDLSLKPLDILSITGNGSNIDSDYIVKSIRRHYSSAAGFIQYVRGVVAIDNSVSSVEPGGIT